MKAIHIIREDAGASIVVSDAYFPQEGMEYDDWLDQLHASLVDAFASDGWDVKS